MLAAGACSTGGSAAGGATSTTSPASGARSRVTLTAVSTDADRVTGGDVLVAVRGATRTPTFRAGGRTLTATAKGADDAGRVLVLLTGLAEGRQTIRMTVGDATASLRVTNHPVEGPVFSGPHLPMPTCTAQNFGLAAPTDDGNCFSPTTTTWKYFTADKKLKALADPDAVPADAYLTGPAGAAGTRPVVVQVETGVINRGVFTIMTPRGVTWNKRLIYRFGGGCGTTYSQGFDLMGDPDPEVVAQGYAIATDTLNTFQVSCNDVLSAETAMMVKEHFAETYGLPDITIGEGGSGGAIQQLLIAQNYPGILDAIAPILPFPDAISISGGVLDCALLNRYYRSPAAADWTTEQKIAVNGHLTAKTCDFWEQTFVPAVDPSKCGFGDAVAGVASALPGLGTAAFPEPPKDQVYDPVSNPTGLRCTLQDINVAVYGKDPATGFARRAWDNVGLQYGLSALDAGAISVDQFLTLNAGIGSHDIDGQWQPSRVAADEQSLRTSYRTGRVTEAGGDLPRIPIILVNLYTDPLGDIHDRYRAFTIRERLRTSDGKQAPNLAIWTRGLPPGKSLIDSLTGAISLGPDIIGTLDTWATKLKYEGRNDRTAPSQRTLDERMTATRPTGGVNSCFEPDGTLVATGDDVYDRPGPCTDPYPLHGDPRIVAGSPLREDVIKCRLMSVDAAITAGLYKVTLTDDQRARLHPTFPDGVCDFTKPGVGQVELGGTWQSFGP
ncbi:MAG: DUF6351 family protein [Acidimicrobiales bacterium]